MIRLALFILLFLWVIKAPTTYRDSIREKVWAAVPETKIKTEDQKKSKLFLQAIKDYKIGDKRRVQAIEKLAQCRWQQLNFDNAERLYKLALVEYKTKNDFDKDRTKIIYDLAAVLNIEQKFDEALYYYSEILKNEKTYLPKNDLRLGCIYNDLGITNYLKASSKERGEERTNLLKQADKYYQQALEIYRAQAQVKTDNDLETILYNKYLALRDLNDIDGAKLAKAQINTIENQLNRAYKAP